MLWSNLPDSLRLPMTAQQGSSVIVFQDALVFIKRDHIGLLRDKVITGQRRQ